MFGLWPSCTSIKVERFCEKLFKVVFPLKVEKDVTDKFPQTSLSDVEIIVHLQLEGFTS